MKWGILAGTIALLLLFGCSMRDYGTETPGPVKIDTKEDAIEACKELCKTALEKEIDLSNGPCLSTGNPDWKINGWVCDIAHFPRDEIDDIKENQCPEYYVTVSKFVELTEQCTLIKAYG